MLTFRDNLPVPSLWVTPIRLWDDAEKYGTAARTTDDSIIWRMRIVCWIAKATETHSEYVILVAFPRQQWLRERARYYVYIRTFPGSFFKYWSCISPEWLKKIRKTYQVTESLGLESKSGTPDYELEYHELCCCLKTVMFSARSFKDQGLCVSCFHMVIAIR